MFDINMVQINSIALFSFLAATLAAPAYKSTYGEEDNVVSINPCFYYDGACHSCPRSEFWDGQCHKFPGDDIIMPGGGRHANREDNHRKGHGHRGRGRHHNNNGLHGNRHGCGDLDSGNDRDNGDWKDHSNLGYNEDGSNGNRDNRGANDGWNNRYSEGTSGNRNGGGNNYGYNGDSSGSTKLRQEGIDDELNLDQLLGLE
ncbi:hypothetical protein DSO57_1011869 [Entomophthora muscae]|uniref:Uncharacterized protein n=1 Tax=Entomophthora muscae TaxID=34485 RepID=A0ACC2S898_9FUNG|nr:hypothetical protein DSO57_1011869 [Entomophthora muscae]